MQASAAPRVPIVHVDFRLCHDRGEPVLATPAMELRIHDPEEEIALGAQPSWDCGMRRIYHLEPGTAKKVVCQCKFGLLKVKWLVVW